MHVFIDPNPDPETTFAERERLFALPRSTWDDFDRSVLSAGGGVYPRSAKSIALSPEAREALGIDVGSLTPNELIASMLKAPVDLVWNGGIGTYVKSRGESHAEVGDRANDVVRVNGEELRCRIVGEGGNLGLTQLGRIEFAAAGGRVNTDAIDNSGGVGLLGPRGEHQGAAERGGVRRRHDREAAQPAPGGHDGRGRGAGASQQLPPDPGAERRRKSGVSRCWRWHSRLIRRLERDGELDREIEFLPGAEEIGERLAARGRDSTHTGAVGADRLREDPAVSAPARFHVCPTNRSW